MFIPDIYKNHDAADIRKFISENGFAILVSCDSGKPLATHLPLMMEVKGDRKILHGHLSAENPHSHFLDGREVLAIFNGPHAYVSSSWYDHENVPTWNYIAVQIAGKARILHGEEKIAHLKKLVDKYEHGRENAVRIEDLSSRTMRQVNGITVFEIEISSIEAARKLSQNRDDKNHARIVSHLENSGDPSGAALAREMRKDRSEN